MSFASYRKMLLQKMRASRSSDGPGEASDILNHKKALLDDANFNDHCFQGYC